MGYQREMMDSREGFSIHQHDLLCQDCGDTVSVCVCADNDNEEPTEDDLAEMSDHFQAMDMEDLLDDIDYNEENDCIDDIWDYFS